MELAVLIILGIAVLDLLRRHKRLTKGFAIVYLLIPVVLGVIDYAWVSSVVHHYNINIDTELKQASGDLGRGIVGACLWVPYFLLTKRVKATLTN
jgi:hypothetical protein